MNCDCIKKIEKDLIGKVRSGRKVLCARLQTVFTFSPVESRTSYSTITLTLEGTRIRSEIEMKHTYCPFCGIKIDDAKSTIVQEPGLPASGQAVTKETPGEQLPGSK